MKGKILKGGKRGCARTGTAYNYRPDYSLMGDERKRSRGWERKKRDKGGKMKKVHQIKLPKSNTFHSSVTGNT